MTKRFITMLHIHAQENKIEREINNRKRNEQQNFVCRRLLAKSFHTKQVSFIHVLRTVHSKHTVCNITHHTMKRRNNNFKHAKENKLYVI